MDTVLQLALLGAVALSVIVAFTAFQRGERRRAESRGGVAPVASVGEALRRVPYGGRILILHVPAGPEERETLGATREDPEVAAALGAPEVRHVVLRASEDAEVAAHVFKKYAGEDPRGLSAVVLSAKGEKLSVAHAGGQGLAAWLPGVLRKD
ncbi:MAG: hypothetical protein R3F62_30180 [Planctomycetota bacterium]